MKRLLVTALAVAAIASCCSEPALLKEMDFNTEVDGKAVSLYTMKNGNVAVQVTNFGARVVSTFTQDRDGKYENIVVGHTNIADYITPPGERFLGAVVGPVANRIGNASFEVDGVRYQTPVNDNGKNTLHGGFKGIDNLVWDVVEACDTAIVLHLLHPDGMEGYPGNLDITLIYTLAQGGEFKVDYSATTDKATPVNLTYHPFFRLRNGCMVDE